MVKKVLATQKAETLMDRKAAPVMSLEMPLKTGSRDLHVPIDTGRTFFINTPG
jgi:hypothetical protein